MRRLLCGGAERSSARSVGRSLITLTVGHVVSRCCY